MLLCEKEVEYLGHILNSDGLKTNPRLVETIKAYPQLQSAKKVRQFLGLSSYHRCFNENFAAMAYPLTVLTRNNDWAGECQEPLTD